MKERDLRYSGRDHHEEDALRFRGMNPDYVKAVWREAKEADDAAIAALSEDGE